MVLAQDRLRFHFCSSQSRYLWNLIRSLLASIAPHWSIGHLRTIWLPYYLVILLLRAHSIADFDLRRQELLFNHFKCLYYVVRSRSREAKNAFSVLNRHFCDVLLLSVWHPFNCFMLCINAFDYTCMWLRSRQSSLDLLQRVSLSFWVRRYFWWLFSVHPYDYFLQVIRRLISCLPREELVWGRWQRTSFNLQKSLWHLLPGVHVWLKPWFISDQILNLASLLIFIAFSWRTRSKVFD